MQSCVAAVILMEKVLNDVEFLVGGRPESILALELNHSNEVFSDDSIDFLSDLSQLLLKNPDTRKFPDVASFAFFCRRANLNQLKNKYSTNIMLGKGIAFHITPGNVPVNFAYSMLSGIVTGNTNIIRVPSKKFEQIEIISNAINLVLAKTEFKSKFENRLFLVRYEKSSIATSVFSSICDVRIIWGGDRTIEEIRKSPIPPKSSEVTFSDRYSISILNANRYLECGDKERLANDFYNDTYLFDQNACTSPQSIYWIGDFDTVEYAKSQFWKYLNNLLDSKKYSEPPIVAIDKLTTFYTQAIQFEDTTYVSNDSNKIWRVNNNELKNNIDHFKCSNGYFNEFRIQKLSDLNYIIKRRYQTVGYFGINKDELLEWCIHEKPIGIDRFVQIGRTLDFDLVWDGIDLVFALSRTISIK